jgi:HK97 family phage portal protein
MSGILQTDQVLKDDAYKRLKEGFETRYAGIDKAHKTAVLEQGLKYQRIGIEPEAAQFLESRRFSIEEIARWFRIPPHMIGDLSKSSFSNIEQQSIDFVTHSLRPHLVRWEQELNKKLFTTEDRKKYFISFNIEGLLRGDAQARAGLYQVLFNTSSITPNEIRSKENMNPIDGGDDVFVQMNMQKTKDLGNEKEGSKEL